MFCLTGIYTADASILSHKLAVDQNFDIIRRELLIAERKAALFFVDGFIKDEVFEKILEFLYKIKPDELVNVKNMEQFSLIKMPYVEVDCQHDPDEAVTAVLSGQAAVIIDGINGVLLVDTRTYPSRSPDEPEKDRSLRGARDGFVETFIFNTALIRRRIRDSSLRMEYHRIGKASKVDVAICYMDKKADKRTVERLRRRIENADISGISMTSEALAEVLIPQKFFNPFPNVRYTERPDFASACLLEGRVLLIMDNSPSVMIFPTSIADFAKETDDYYFPPFTGTYVRILRLIVSIATVVLTPTMLILMNNPDIVPKWLSFINTTEDYIIPFFFQFLLLEIVIDGLRLASLNTPDSLSSSLGIIGALVLSEFAVNAQWFVSETIIYMAFVTIAGFAQPSFEMGYAMKFSRIFLLVLSQLAGFFGLFAGIIMVLMLAASTETLSGRSYFYPIIPFNLHDFRKIFIRKNINKSRAPGH